MNKHLEDRMIQGLKDAKELVGEKDPAFVKGVEEWLSEYAAEKAEQKNQPTPPNPHEV